MYNSATRWVARMTGRPLSNVIRAACISIALQGMAPPPSAAGARRLPHPERSDVYHRDSGTAALVDERRTGAGDKAELRLSPATSVETRRRNPPWNPAVGCRFRRVRLCLTMFSGKMARSASPGGLYGWLAGRGEAITSPFLTGIRYLVLGVKSPLSLSCI